MGKHLKEGTIKIVHEPGEEGHYRALHMQDIKNEAYKVDPSKKNCLVDSVLQQVPTGKFVQLGETEGIIEKGQAHIDARSEVFNKLCAQRKLVAQIDPKQIWEGGCIDHRLDWEYLRELDNRKDPRYMAVDAEWVAAETALQAERDKPGGGDSERVTHLKNRVIVCQEEKSAVYNSILLAQEAESRRFYAALPGHVSRGVAFGSIMHLAAPIIVPAYIAYATVASMALDPWVHRKVFQGEYGQVIRSIPEHMPLARHSIHFYQAVREGDVGEALWHAGCAALDLGVFRAYHYAGASKYASGSASMEDRLKDLGRESISAPPGGHVFVHQGVPYRVYRPYTLGRDQHQVVIWMTRPDGSVSRDALMLPGGAQPPKALPPLASDAISKQGNQLKNPPVKIKPSGLGSTGRTTPKNLNEQLAMKEVMADPQAIGLFCENMGPLNDARWKGWFKMKNRASNGVEIHFNAKMKDGKIIAVDDFKFKNT